MSQVVTSSPSITDRSAKSADVDVRSKDEALLSDVRESSDAFPNFYQDRQHVVYLSSTDQCAMDAIILGGPTWVAASDFELAPILPEYTCAVGRKLHHHVPLRRLRQPYRGRELVLVDDDDGRTCQSGIICQVQGGQTYMVQLDEGGQRSVPFHRIRRVYTKDSRISIFGGQQGWLHGTVLKDFAEESMIANAKLAARGLPNIMAELALHGVQIEDCADESMIANAELPSRSLPSNEALGADEIGVRIEDTGGHVLVCLDDAEEPVEVPPYLIYAAALQTEDVQARFGKQTTLLALLDGARAPADDDEPLPGTFCV